MEKSLSRGLELFGVEKVHIYYAHMPNEKTPAEETARAFHKQFLAGRFDKVSGIFFRLTDEVSEVVRVLLY